MSEFLADIGPEAVVGFALGLSLGILIALALLAARWPRNGHKP